MDEVLTRHGHLLDLQGWNNRRARRRRLLDGNRIGRRKGVLEGFVERLFQAPALIAIAIVLIRFAFRIGNHFGFSDGTDEDLRGYDANFGACERYLFRVIRLRTTYSWRHIYWQFSHHRRGLEANAPAEAPDSPLQRRRSSPTSAPSRRRAPRSGARVRATRRTRPPNPRA